MKPHFIKKIFCSFPKSTPRLMGTSNLIFINNKILKMKNIIFISLLLLTVITVSDISSQTNYNFAQKNTWAIGGSFSISKNYKEFATYGGYYITDGFELGVIPAVEFLKDKDNSITAYAIYAAPSFNFNTESNVYPYIQPEIGYYNISGPEYSGLTLGIEGGVKANIFGDGMLKLAVDLNKKYFWRFFTSNKEDWEETISFVAGLSIFFK